MGGSTAYTEYEHICKIIIFYLMTNKLTKKQNNIIILGATGFIGKNIALYYSRNLKIKATYNKRIPFENKIVFFIIIKYNLLSLPFSFLLSL